MNKTKIEGNFETAFEKVQKLAIDFESQFTYYTSSQYSEAAVRTDFIDKLFFALGWDVAHDYQKNPYLQEVKIENPQKQHLSKAQRRADYAFFLQPDYKNPKFFVEAKKPARILKNADDYFQTMRYGWNAGTGISVLTDFEEFHIIDCRLEPDINEVFNADHQIIRFTEYKDKEKFSKIYWTFSYEAVVAGNIEKYIDNLRKPKGGAKQGTLFGGRYQDIDESFLEYIDDIRDKIARAFKRNDESLDSETLTEAVQRTIDRLVFIRFLEDKLIEPNYYVSQFGERNTSWRDFIATCRSLDAKYNGVVFKEHFIDALDLNIETEYLFRNICNDFSHLNSKYLFNYIPIHILGSIYERFLGKIVVSNDKKVRIEEKPEVRKAGGVYYTPKYIVDYIIANTIGEIIKGKSPKEIAKLKFGDISCGSGSFLIGVLEKLFDHHIKYYNNNPKEAEKDKCHKIVPKALEKDSYDKSDVAYTLTIKQKQNILLNNIYGIDIDHQATEVTQLSLYLKMMEDETTATANEMQVLFHEKILPDLSNNIKCGNSLIDLDIMKNSLFEEDNINFKKLNPMNFKAAFPKLLDHCFDAIIGNPPYGAELSNVERDYLLKVYPYGNTDTAALFMLKANRLLRKNGKVGFIIPKAFTYASNWKKTRDFLIDDISEIIDCSKVWNNVKLEMSIYISEKDSNSSTFESLVRINDKFKNVSTIPKQICKEFDFLVNGVSLNEIKIALQMKSSGYCFNDFITNLRGGMFQNLVKKNGTIKVLGGKQISRYKINNIIKGYVNKSDLIEEKSLIKENSILVQNIVAHVMNPYPHIIIMATIPEATTSTVILDTVNQLLNSSQLSPLFILGILNSKLINWYTYKFVFANAIRTMHFDSITTKKIPFPKINLQNSDQSKIHNEIVELVRQRLKIQSNIDEEKTDRNKNVFFNMKDSIETNIDQLVESLFGVNYGDLNQVN